MLLRIVVRQETVMLMWVVESACCRIRSSSEAIIHCCNILNHANITTTTSFSAVKALVTIGTYSISVINDAWSFLGSIDCEHSHHRIIFTFLFDA